MKKLIYLLVLVMVFSGLGVGVEWVFAESKKLDFTLDMSNYEQVERTIPQKVVNPPTEKNIVITTHIIMNDATKKITFLGYEVGEGGYPNYFPEQQPCPLIVRIFSQEEELLGEYGFLWWDPRIILPEYDPSSKTTLKNPRDVDEDMYLILPRFDNSKTVEIHYGCKLILSFDVMQ